MFDDGVVDRKVEQANELKAMRDTDVSRVRSVTGAAWAVPLYTSVHSAKLSDGNFKSILLVGLDNSTLVGRPGEMLSGKLEDVRLPNSVIVDDLAVRRLSAGRAKPLGVGDSFEINVVPKRSLTGDSSERVDTRVLQIIFEMDRPAVPLYVGQQVDVFIQRSPMTNDVAATQRTQP